MGDRGRGRVSRGRARGSITQGGAQQQGAPRPGPPAQQAAWGGRPGTAQPPVGVWAGRATPIPQAQTAPGTWGVRPPAPEAVQVSLLIMMLNYVYKSS